ncbi:hypothetical protein D3C84_776700 [compost metagenome]
MAAERDAGLVDDPLVHRAGHHGGKLAAQVAVTGPLQGGQHIGAVVLIQLTRHHGGAEFDWAEGQGAGPLRVGRGAGIIGFQHYGQPQQGGPRQQQVGIGDHHQLMGPIPLGYLQHQIRTYARRFTRRDGETTTAHLLLDSIWMLAVHLLIAH